MKINYKTKGQFCDKYQKITLLYVLLTITSFSFAQNQELASPENLVKHLYDQVTFPAEETPDWKYVRTLFHNDATVTMRLSKTESTTLTLDGWILDFVNFINDADVATTGFQEKIVKMESMVFGDIAHVLVLYTSYIPGKSKAPREGVDSFHLAKADGKWKIISILNEIPSTDRPKPKALN